MADWQWRVEQREQAEDHLYEVIQGDTRTFTDQEDKLESHRQQIRELDKQIQQAQNALDAYLGDLEIV